MEIKKFKKVGGGGVTKLSNSSSEGILYYGRGIICLL